MLPRSPYQRPFMHCFREDRMTSLRRIVAAAAALACIAYAVPASADPVTLLSVQSGHSVLLNTHGLTRVAVGDGRIAGVVPVGTSQVVVNGKLPGHTTVIVWTHSGRQTYE